MSDPSNKKPARRDLPPIAFAALAAALLDRIDTLLPKWLPGGQWRGKEYVAARTGDGGPGDSLTINRHNGSWGHFALGAQGRDLISLFGHLNDLDNAQAAIQVSRDEGLEDVAQVLKVGEKLDAIKQRPAPAPQPPRKPPSEPEGWRTIAPVPPNVPEVNFRHQHRQPADIERVFEYRVGDDLYGYVVRFRTSDGGKETPQRTWAQSARDGAAKWHWKHWDEPRPLFLPGRKRPGVCTVILVEGEWKAEVLQTLLDATAPGVYCVVSWPGGSGAWKKADWSWLAGLDVICWPDCDAKHEDLTRQEKAATPDRLAQQVLRQSKPLKPEHEQPGMKAMLEIGAHLRDTLNCRVQLLPIPKPGEVIDGWDCRDAIEADGWDGERVLAFFGSAYMLPADAGEKKRLAQPDRSPPPDVAKEEKLRDTLAEAQDDEYDEFVEHLEFITEAMKCKVHEIPVTRSLLIAALRKSSGLKDCLGFDELRFAPCTKNPWPWRDQAGPLADTDDLRLGDWLVRQYRIKAASRAALHEAIETVADAQRFHPIRDWLNGLQHDGVARLDKWLMHVLQMPPDTLTPRRQRYLSLVGRFILMGLVARVMEPGVKFDYSMVLEGKGGIGKSTFVKALVGDEFFSDTHFDIGSGKEPMEQLAGLWAYELGELTAFRKADSEQIKQFFSSQTDRFRGAYGRYVQSHPRQCVIFCTTNKRQYLYDLTGNRRFWPIWIGAPILLAWLRKYRAQLFAEAFAAWRTGERIFPTYEEEEEFFVPEQAERLVETAVQSRLYDMLTREGAHVSEGRASNGFNQHTPFVTIADLVSALGSDAAKSSSLLESQVRGWLEMMGWTHHREGGGQRRRGFRRPEIWPPAFKDDEVTALPAHGEDQEIDPPSAQGVDYGGDDDEPF